MPEPDPSLRQLYDGQGRPVPGRGAGKQEILSQGLLHGASHVWIWRSGQDGPEIMLQKRADAKQTWPGRLDISAAGHIDLHETPLEAAVRETREEIGLAVRPDRLACFGVWRAHEVPYPGAVENEFQWLYLLRLTDTGTGFTLQASEVAGLSWEPLDDFVAGTAGPRVSGRYVPHDPSYYGLVAQAVRAAAAAAA